MVMDAVGAVAGAVGQFTDLFRPEKAKLNVVDGTPQSGTMTLECMFNPTDYKLSRSMSIPRNESAGQPGGTPSYGGVGELTLNMTLFFDEFHLPKGDVTPSITTLLDWMKPTVETKDTPDATAPTLEFKWGGNPQIAGVHWFLQSLNVTYSIFRKDGTPIQAEAVLTLSECPERQPGQNPTSRATNSRRMHTVVDGDTIQSIAFRELGDPTYWRSIADLNLIDDPLRIPPGTTLLMPSRADAARRA